MVCGPGGSSDGARAPPAHAHPLSIVLSPPPCAQTRLRITLHGACAQKWGTSTRCPFASISPLPSLHITPTLQNTHQPPTSPPCFEPVPAPLTLMLAASCRSPSYVVSTRWREPPHSGSIVKLWRCAGGMRRSCEGFFSFRFECARRLFALIKWPRPAAVWPLCARLVYSSVCTSDL